MNQPTRSTKRKKRLLIPKLLFWPVLAFGLLSQSRVIEAGFWDTTFEVVSLVLLTVGAIGRVWVAAYISGRKSVELVTDGPYSMTRNPLYFFSFIAYVGAGLAFEKLTLAVVFGVLFYATHWSTIISEETKLREAFGEQFDAYARRVPRFVPRLSLLRLPEYVTFRTAAFNRAVLDCGLIITVFLLAHVIEYGQNCNVVPILIKGIP